MSGSGDVGSLMAARVSVAVVVDLGAISGVPGDGGCDQRVIRSRR